MAGAWLRRTSSLPPTPSASGVCVWSRCYAWKQHSEQKRAQSGKESDLGYFPPRSETQWRGDRRLCVEGPRQGSPCPADKGACRNSPHTVPAILPPWRPEDTWPVAPGRPEADRGIVSMTALLVGDTLEALPEKPKFTKKRPSLAWKWKRTWLTHFPGAKLILNRRPPMAWTEARTVSQIWAHCFSSICTLYTCKPNLSPGAKSALVRASGCPGMSWYKESHWLHWDKWAIAWQKLKFMEKGTFQGVVSWVTFSMATILKPIAKKWGKSSDSPARKVFSLVRNTFQLQNMHLIQPPLFLHAFSHSFILCLPRPLCSSMYGKERKFQAWELGFSKWVLRSTSIRITFQGTKSRKKAKLCLTPVETESLAMGSLAVLRTQNLTWRFVRISDSWITPKTGWSSNYILTRSPSHAHSRIH